MAGISGNLIGLKINGAFVSCETSCEFSFENDMIPCSAEDSAGWKEFIMGIRSWKMVVNAGLLLESVGADIKTIITGALMARLPIFLQFSTRPSSTLEMIISGSALPNTGGITAPSNASANWNCTFQGTGPLSTTFQDYLLLIDAMPPEADYPIIVNEDVI